MTEKEKKADGEISIKDAYRLKHELNKDITYAGMNAKEISNFKKTSADEWKKIRDDYDKWIKQIRAWGSKTLIAVLVLSGVAFFYFSDWIKTASLVVVLYCIMEIAKREGHREGYIDGFDAGKEEGINKTLGINDEELADVHERAIEMEIDERLVSKWKN